VGAGRPRARLEALRDGEGTPALRPSTRSRCGTNSPPRCRPSRRWRGTSAPPDSAT
jgi:hypothetical protein